MAEPALAKLPCGQLCYFSLGAPGKDTANEDAIALIPAGPNAAVIAVADGMGGQSSGEVAARVALEAIIRTVSERAEDTALRTAILDGIEQANHDVLALSNGAATTLSLVEIADNTCRPYHVGDSMILMMGGRGRIKMQVIAHSPVGYGIEAGLLDAEESLSHAERHLVSNFVGTSEMRIEIGPPVRLARLDTLVVASDGLADNLTAAEIVERARSGPLSGAGNKLAADTLSRMRAEVEGTPSKPDDLSFVLFRPSK